MLFNYIKITVRNIINNKIYSLINISGLAIGLTCFILILLYIRYELNYESHHENAENIYRVNVIQQHPNRAFKTSYSMVPLAPALKAEIPAIEDFVRIEQTGNTLVSYNDKKFIEDRIMYSDPGLLSLFTIPFLAGNPESALTSKFSIVITKSIAVKYFGDKNPIGEILILDNADPHTVTGVVEDFPENTHISADFIVSFNTIEDLASESFMTNWITTRLFTYVLIRPNQDPDVVEERMNAVMNAQSKGDVPSSLELEKFTRIHLYSDVSKFGDIQYLYLFAAIGILILIIASINFMNLSTARSQRRSSEVGVRKVVGANKLQLIRQFLGESILLSFLSLILASLLVANILPFFREVTEQALDMPAWNNFEFYSFILITTVFVGLVSGSYPAFFLTAMPPMRNLRGDNTSKGTGSNLRRLLVVVQFSIAIALIVVTITINDQLDYMFTKNLGFNHDQIVVVPVSGGEFRQNTEPFKQELCRHPNIKAVAGSYLLPSRIGMYNNVTWEGAAENESIALMQNKVDYDFLNTYDIEIVKGRNFSPEFGSDLTDAERDNIAGPIILNEEAVRRFGWQNPVGKYVIQTYGEERIYFKVVGVLKDFHFSSLHYSIKPLSLFLRPNYPRYFSIKIADKEIQNSIAHMRKSWETFNPQFPFEYYFIDDVITKSYRSEEKLRLLFSSFSFLSIMISCLGLLGLAAYAAEKRTKEIGIRKVVGASISDILFMLSRDFTKWILLANLIAWPLAWFYLISWLNDFAYRAGISYWNFIFAGGLALFIAILTVSFQTLKAAQANPVNSLRYE